MRERSVKNDETDYYRTRETPSTSPGPSGRSLGARQGLAAAPDGRDVTSVSPGGLRMD